MATLISAATATGAGSAIQREPGYTSFLGHGTTTAGAGAATINIEVAQTSDGPWLVAGTITLVLATTITTTTNTDGFNINAGWRFMRANVTAISGTGAAVTVMI